MSPASAATISALLLTLASCGGSDGTGPDSQVVTVTVSPETFSLLAGEIRQLSASDQEGRVLAGSGVTWVTSAPTVAVVSGSGRVTGMADGSATITATAEGKSGTAGVTVRSLAFASVAAGGAHTCALAPSGAAYCWGRSEGGQVGVASPASICPIGTQAYPCSLIPVAVQGGLVFTALDAGGEHVCALTSAGAAWCWGRNHAGQLGDNTTTHRFAPVAVTGGLTFASLSLGTLHTCGLTAQGAALCWGSNSRGQLGDGSTTDRAAPVAVTGGLAFEQITAGGSQLGYTCALTTAGQAYCWGDNGGGQLGIGVQDQAAHSAPAPVSGVVVFASLSAGLGSHTCGLTSAGSAFCWGANAFGALGDGTTASRFSPVPVGGGIVFAQIIAGGFIGHTCGVTGSGKAYCWGENEVGAIGDGTLLDPLAPSAVAGGHSFSSLDAGFRHTCGRTTAGVLYCWGSNGAGQLGVNSTAMQISPARVVGQLEP
jgi:alpha-tubulin suppressor-like RCC1 family protein